MARSKFDPTHPHLQNDSHYYTLKYLVDTAAFRGKSYCFPAQETICGAVRRYGVYIGRRMLNYILKDLEESGQIKRIRRHYAGQNGMQMRSTLYIITKKGKGLLSRFLSRLTGVWTFKRKKKSTQNAKNEQQYKPVTFSSADERKAFFENMRRRIRGIPSASPA